VFKGAKVVIQTLTFKTLAICFSYFFKNFLERKAGNFQPFIFPLSAVVFSLNPREKSYCCPSGLGNKVQAFL